MLLSYGSPFVTLGCLDINFLLITPLTLKCAAKIWGINAHGHMTQAIVIHFYLLQCICFEMYEATINYWVKYL